MLDANIKKQLDTYLNNITNPIEITVSTDHSAKAEELVSLAREITELSEKISLTVNENGSGRVPQMAIAPQGETPRVAFAGIPLGHEFTSLVLALLQAGGHPPKEDAAVVEQARELTGQFEFTVYASLSCQNCPTVVQALNLLARLNPNVSTTMVDGALFQDEVAERNIMAVPTVYLNGEEFGQGRMTLAEILNKVDTGAAARQAAALNEKDPFDVLVVGGGPAGA